MQLKLTLRCTEAQFRASGIVDGVDGATEHWLNISEWDGSVVVVAQSPRRETDLQFDIPPLIRSVLENVRDFAHDGYLRDVDGDLNTTSDQSLVSDDFVHAHPSEATHLFKVIGRGYGTEAGTHCLEPLESWRKLEDLIMKTVGDTAQRRYERVDPTDGVLASLWIAFSVYSLLLLLATAVVRRRHHIVGAGGDEPNATSFDLFQEKLYFWPQSSDLLPSTLPVLGELADVIKRDGLSVKLQGVATSIGALDADLALANDRARHVRAELEALGVPSESLHFAQGHVLTASEDSPDGYVSFERL